MGTGRLTLFRLMEKALTKDGLDASDAPALTAAVAAAPEEAIELAGRMRQARFGNVVDACAIINAKSGDCPEDCAFCAQSVHHDTDIEAYQLVDEETVLNAAKKALEHGVRRFCIVTSGRRVDDEAGLDKVAGYISALKKMGMMPCATLGSIDADAMKVLKDAGLNRLHHNLETSRRMFPEVCTTHTYDERIGTIRSAKALGLSVCSGGILGLGEGMEDRAEMALELRDAGVDSVPVNILMPVPGTPFEGADFISPVEALVSIALFRFIMPTAEIRVCGGRVSGLRDMHTRIFSAGANGILTGDYLTTTGRDYASDLRMIAQLGMRPGYGDGR